MGALVGRGELDDLRLWITSTGQTQSQLQIGALAPIAVFRPIEPEEERVSYYHAVMPMRA